MLVKSFTRKRSPGSFGIPLFTLGKVQARTSVLAFQARSSQRLNREGIGCVNARVQRIVSHWHASGYTNHRFDSTPISNQGGLAPRWSLSFVATRRKPLPSAPLCGEGVLFGGYFAPPPPIARPHASPCRRSRTPPTRPRSPGSRRYCCLLASP